MHEAYRIVRIQHGLSPTPPEYAQVPASPIDGANGSSVWPSPAPLGPESSVGHLSLFNQHMQQQSKFVEWVYADSEGEGTKTTPIWVARAMVDGECLGRGRGNTKKAAKNEAAKEGLQKLGLCSPYVMSDS